MFSFKGGARAFQKSPKSPLDSMKKSLYNARVNAKKNRSSALFPVQRAPGRWKGERGAGEVPFGAAGLKPFSGA